MQSYLKPEYQHKYTIHAHITYLVRGMYIEQHEIACNTRAANHVLKWVAPYQEHVFTQICSHKTLYKTHANTKPMIHTQSNSCKMSTAHANIKGR